jgi:hypothetical protein
MVSLPPDDLNARPLIDDEPDEPETESYAAADLAEKMPLYNAVTDPMWLIIGKHLAQRHDDALEALVAARTPETVAARQAEVKMLRELIDLPRQLGNEIRSLQQVMEGD